MCFGLNYSFSQEVNYFKIQTPLDSLQKQSVYPKNLQFTTDGKFLFFSAWEDSLFYYTYDLANWKLINKFTVSKSINSYRSYFTANDSTVILKGKKYWEVNLISGTATQINKPDTLISNNYYSLDNFWIKNRYSCDKKYLFELDILDGINVYQSNTTMPCYTTSNNEYLRWKIPAEFKWKLNLAPPIKQELALFEYRVDEDYIIATYGFRPTYLVFYDKYSFEKKYEIKLKSSVYLAESWFDKDDSTKFIVDIGYYFKKLSYDLNTNEKTLIKWKEAYHKSEYSSESGHHDDTLKTFENSKYYVSQNDSIGLGLYQTLYDSCDSYMKYRQNSFAYWEPKSWGLILGASGIRNNFIEIGVARNTGTTWSSESKPFGGFWFTYSKATYQSKLDGLNLTFFAGSTICLGLNTNIYRSDDNYRFGIKPMIGFSMYRLSLTYGYNFKVMGVGFNDFQKSEVALRYHLPVFYKKRNKKN